MGFHVGKCIPNSSHGFDDVGSLNLPMCNSWESPTCRRPVKNTPEVSIPPGHSWAFGLVYKNNPDAPKCMKYRHVTCTINVSQTWRKYYILLSIWAWSC